LENALLAGLRTACALAVATSALLATPSLSTAATVVEWDTFATTDGTTTYKFSFFDNGTRVFSGFTANTLTLISGPANMQDRGADRRFKISILLDGSWTEIYNSGPTYGTFGNVLLSTLSPLAFPEGEVTALSFSVNSHVDTAYNRMLGTEFTFDLVTPLPAALPLFGSGLGLIYWMSRRRKRNAARPV
jgi:hypothetical protein